MTKFRIDYVKDLEDDPYDAYEVFSDYRLMLEFVRLNILEFGTMTISTLEDDENLDDIPF